jgi:hypothetical protein
VQERTVSSPMETVDAKRFLAQLVAVEVDCD